MAKPDVVIELYGFLDPTDYIRIKVICGHCRQTTTDRSLHLPDDDGPPWAPSPWGIQDAEALLRHAAACQATALYYTEDHQP